MGNQNELPPTRMYTKWGEMIVHWPKTTFLIVANEFCERFSYYGMRTVLILYLLNVLKFSDQTSTVFFNIFDILCYTTPILGSILADGYIGKYWTIFSVSILYACGQIVLAIASTKNEESSVHPGMDFAGLVIIAFGTGGIKPCVSAFGADQFDPRQERMISIYFSVFYFSINAGSMISTFISPIFRSMPCMGQDSCYPLTFGVPACLMIIATVVFMSGSWWYKKNPPKENIFSQVAVLLGVSDILITFSFIQHGFGNYVRSKEKKEHWLDNYMNDHDCSKDKRCQALTEEKGRPVCHKSKLVEDVKSLLRVIIMLLPVPVFWSLYNQQGSIWLIQGIQMDCRLSDSLLILPDQMQVLNAVLILVFIPIFQAGIYPLVGFVGIKLTPLRKMVAGGLLASLAFVLAGFVQIGVNATLPTVPNNGMAFVSVWNQMWKDEHRNCTFNATIRSSDYHKTYTIGYNETLIDDKKEGTSTFHIPWPTSSGKVKKDSTWTVTMDINFDNTCQNLESYKLSDTSIKLNLKNKKIYFAAVNYNGIYYTLAKPDKPTEGTGEFSMGIISAMDSKDNIPGYGLTNNDNLALCRVYPNTSKYYNTTGIHPCDPKRPSDFYWWETNYNNNDDDRIDYPMFTNGLRDGENATMYDFKPVKPGRWHLYYVLNKPKDVKNKTYTKYQVEVQDAFYEFEYHAQGGVYVLAMTGPKYKNTTDFASYSNQPQIWQLVASNKVNIMWQVPQIVVITAAEILFSITGYEFAYSQSAKSMKALVQALWLFTIALGDMIIIAITAINPFPNAATQFFAFAGIMAAVMGVFCLLAIFFYEYRDIDTGDDPSEATAETGSLHSMHSNLIHPLEAEAIKPKENWDDNDSEDLRF